MLFLPLVGSGETVEHDLHGAQDGRQEGPLALEHPGHVPAEGFYQDHDGPAEEEDLDPAVDGHLMILRQNRSGRRSA